MSPVTARNNNGPFGLGWFVVLVFGLLWSVMVPAALAAHGMLHLRVPRGLQFLAEFAPTLAAIVATIAIGGRKSLPAFAGRLLRIKISWRWYALALFVPLATQLMAFGVYCLVRNAAPRVDDFLDWPMVMALYVPVCLMQEEIGWRGFFLDGLMQRTSLWGATLWMAGVWGLWHLPTFLAQSSGQLYLIFLAGIIPASAWFSFIYSRTRSVVLCAILHASLNAGLPNWLAPLPTEGARFAFGIWIGLFWLATIPVFFALRKERKPSQMQSPEAEGAREAF
ncbi:MAG TPA: CPBP family intramembrane glutamic endopeptidase [Opitutaceae bacterium]|nr:CPBP family intramembrane glutamic endopeptidase [Opitutaceae bacterium]